MFFLDFLIGGDERLDGRVAKVLTSRHERTNVAADAAGDGAAVVVAAVTAAAAVATADASRT